MLVAAACVLIYVPFCLPACFHVDHVTFHPPFLSFPPPFPAGCPTPTAVGCCRCCRTGFKPSAAFISTTTTTTTTAVEAAEVAVAIVTTATAQEGRGRSRGT